MAVACQKFIYQNLQFLTYNSEQKPFPFADWPEADKVVELDATPAAKTETPKKPEPAAELANDEAKEAEDFIRQEDA